MTICLAHNSCFQLFVRVSPLCVNLLPSASESSRKWDCCAQLYAHCIFIFILPDGPRDALSFSDAHFTHFFLLPTIELSLLSTCLTLWNIYFCLTALPSQHSSLWMCWLQTKRPKKSSAWWKCVYKLAENTDSFLMKPVTELWIRMVF